MKTINASVAGYPYTAIAHVTAYFPDGTVISGTGSVVGINDVLTASHLVYQEDLGGAAERLRVIPGLDGDEAPFGDFWAEEWQYFPLQSDEPGKLSAAQSEFDIALLGFSQALGEQTGMFELDREGEAGAYRLTGYPGIYADSEGPRMIEDSGYAASLRGYDLFDIEDFEVNPGNSGGPLWEWRDGVPFLTGVVSTNLWAVEVQAHYERLIEWMAGNDSLLPSMSEPLVEPEPEEEPVPDPLVASFVDALAAEGWEVGEDFTRQLETAESLHRYPELAAVIDPVMRLYLGMLGRLPDREGAEYWINELDTGGSLGELAAGFATSDEFESLVASLGGGDAERVEALYRNVLEREPDAEGRAYWLEALASDRLGMADLVLSFTESAEYREASSDLVQGGKWLLWDVNLADLPVTALGLDEGSFADDIVRLYTGLLGRQPDEDGFAYWLEAVSEGAPLETLGASFAQSEEFLDGTEEPTVDELLDALYASVLGREPDEGGKLYWQQQVDQRLLDHEDLVLAFTQSEEYVAMSEDVVAAFLDTYPDLMGVTGLRITLGEEGLIG